MGHTKNTIAMKLQLALASLAALAAATDLENLLESKDKAVKMLRTKPRLRRGREVSTRTSGARMSSGTPNAGTSSPSSRGNQLALTTLFRERRAKSFTGAWLAVIRKIVLLIGLA